MSDVEDRVVSCDGGGGALGHPKVYINLVIIYLIKYPGRDMIELGMASLRYPQTAHTHIIIL